MTEASRQPKDKNYNLISALYQASDNIETFKTYAQDARNEGDQELTHFFEMVIEPKEVSHRSYFPSAYRTCSSERSDSASC